MLALWLWKEIGTVSYNSGIISGKDEPSNFVLLCHRCHIDNPNISDKLKKMLEKIFTQNNYDGTVSYISDNPDDILKYIVENDLLSYDGLVIVEFQDEELLLNYEWLELIKNKKYGYKNVYIYGRNKK